MMNEQVSLPMFAADVVVIGAPKCGTSALVDILAAHPGVCVSRIKEPRFYSRQLGDLEGMVKGSGPKLTGTFDKGFDWYESLFEEGEVKAQIRIEATTDYISREDTPDLLKQYNPNVKLILMIRNPVDRVYSHFLEEDKLGYELGSFDDMVKKGHSRMYHYIDTSDYPKHLSRYLEAGFSGQIMVIAMETFKETPEILFSKFTSFIELDDDDQVQWDFSTQRNVQRTVKFRSLARWVTKLQYSPLAMRFSPNIRRRLHIVRNFVMNIISSESKGEGMSKESRTSLEHHLQESISFCRDIQNNGGYKFF